MHVASCVKSDVQPFSERSWTTFVQSCFLWENLETKESEVAKHVIVAFNLNSSGASNVPNKSGYHRECYHREFTNKGQIARASKRRETAAKDEGLYQLQQVQ